MKEAAFESNHIRAGLKDWLGLAVLSLPALLVSVDLSIMILALPHISVALGVNSTGQLWIMDIYGFMLSGFLITMGTLGDRIGRRKLLMIGATAFGMASLLASFSITAGMLIAARALLGIAGAALLPSTLALISNMFRDHKERSLAIGIWFMCSMGGMALGPVIGGIMLGHFPWGALFLLGVPVMALLLVTAPFLLPEFRNPASGRMDILSVVLSLCAILPAIYGLKEIAKQGLHPFPLIAVAAGAFFGILFVRRQQRLDYPLMDLRLFRNSAFSAALGGMIGITLTGASMLFVAQYLQFVEGLSPLQTAIYMLPGVAASMAGMLLSPLIARRIRPSHLIGAGLAVSAIGCTLLFQVGSGTGLSDLIVGYIFFNAGTTPFASLSSDLIVGSAPPEKAGSAASLLQTSGEFAFALGIAVFGSIGTYVYHSHIAGFLLKDVPTLTAGASRESLAGAVLEANGLPQSVGSKLLQDAQLAFTDSMHVVVEICGVLFICIAILSVIMLRHIRPIGQKADGEMDMSMQE